jgi:hypothetical protein
MQGASSGGWGSVSVGTSHHRTSSGGGMPDLFLLVPARVFLSGHRIKKPNFYYGYPQ